MSGIDQLAKFFRDRDNEKKELGNITIGEVVEYSEDNKSIKLKMFGFEFTKNISIAKHLLKGYERSFDIREFNVKGTLKSVDDITINNFLMSTPTPISPGQFAVPYVADSPKPLGITIGTTATGTLGLEDGQYEIVDSTGDGIITWNKDVLKAGDKVKVHISWDQEHFYIMDKFEAFV